MGEYVQCGFLALVSCPVFSVSIQVPLLGPITFQSLHSKVRLTPHPNPHPLSSPPTHPSIRPLSSPGPHPSPTFSLLFSPSNENTNVIIFLPARPSFFKQIKHSSWCPSPFHCPLQIKNSPFHLSTSSTVINPPHLPPTSRLQIPQTILPTSHSPPLSPSTLPSIPPSMCPSIAAL